MSLSLSRAATARARDLGHWDTPLPRPNAPPSLVAGPRRRASSSPAGSQARVGIKHMLLFPFLRRLAKQPCLWAAKLADAGTTVDSPPLAPGDDHPGTVGPNGPHPPPTLSVCLGYLGSYLRPYAHQKRAGFAGMYSPGFRPASRICIAIRSFSTS